MKITMILNEEPYGNERSYNALRYATALLSGSDITLRVFLLGGGVVCALKNQKTPEGYYNVGRMLEILAKRKAEIRACGTCMDARGISQDMLVEGVTKGSMGVLVDWTLESDHVINF
jgi:uncharacterized protein involved in oxidation of intracellular sulfur